MVRNPVVGSISQMLLSFNSPSQAFVESLPEMEGKTFGELFKWSDFPPNLASGPQCQFSTR